MKRLARWLKSPMTILQASVLACLIGELVYLVLKFVYSFFKR